MSTPARSDALLRVHRHAAVDGRARDRRVIREALDLVVDLRRELARRREDERARDVVRLARAAFAVLAKQTRDRTGSTYAAVLPVPVSAQPMTSRPARAYGSTAL